MIDDLACEAICRLNRIKALHDVEIDTILNFIVEDDYDIGGLIHRLRRRFCDGVANNPLKH